MSESKYITVSACIDNRAYVNIDLPENWDELNDVERIAYLKQEALKEMKTCYSDNFDNARFWRIAT